MLPPGKTDLNNASFLTIKNYLMDKDPLHLGTEADQKYTAQAQAIVDYRDKIQGGVLNSLDQLKSAPGVDPRWWLRFRMASILSDFGVRNVANHRTPGGRPVAHPGWIGHALFVAGNAGLPGFPL